MGKEGDPSTPAEDGQAELGSSASKHERHSDDGHHSREAPTAYQVSTVRHPPIALTCLTTSALCLQRKGGVRSLLYGLPAMMASSIALIPAILVGSFT
jgi:hypothetical protein